MKKQQLLANVILALVLSVGAVSYVKAETINHIDKVMMVGEGHTFSENISSNLVIELKDKLVQGDVFYLELEGAKWAVNSDKNQIKALVNNEEGMLETKKVTDKLLEVKVVTDNIDRAAVINVELITTLTSDVAKVKIDSNNTTVSDGEFEFAKGSSLKADVQTEICPVIGSGKVNDIIIAEPYSGFFSGQENSNEITVSLNTDDYEWIAEDAKISGIRGFDAVDTSVATIKAEGSVLKITLPQVTDIAQKGNWVISGLEIKKVNRDSKVETIKATFKGNGIETKVAEIAKITNYDTTLNVPEEINILSGKTTPVKFEVKEAIADSIMKNKTMEVIFDGEVSLPVDEYNRVTVKHNGEVKKYNGLSVNGVIKGFEIREIENKDLTQSFEVDVVANVVDTQASVNVTITGRAMEKDLTGVVANVMPTIEMSVEPVRLQVGFKDQTGGVITVTEKEAGAFSSGKDILLAFEDGDVSIINVPNVTVTKGDLKLGTPEKVTGGYRIPVLVSSTEASEFVIDGFKYNVNLVASTGRYNVTLGGKAVSDIAEDAIPEKGNTSKMIKAAEGTLVKIGKLDDEIKAVATFTLGSKIYSVNGEAHQMDVRPYQLKGKMMLPLKYVASALGLEDYQVVWDNSAKKITITTDKVVELTLWGKDMFIDGVPTRMGAKTMLDEGRIFIPVADVAKALDVQVDWDSITKSATFTAMY